MTASLPHRAKYLLEHISARLTFRNRLNAIYGKTLAQTFFKQQLKSFPLRLLGTLFCFFPQFLNLALHRGNQFLFFYVLELEFLLYFLPLLLNRGLGALFHLKVYFTLGVIELALFAEKISFSFLRLLQFLVALFEDFFERFHLLRLCFQVRRGYEFRFFSLRLRNRSSFYFQLFLNLLINRAPFPLNLFSLGSDFVLSL